MTEISQKLKEDIFNLWLGRKFSNFCSSSSADYERDKRGEFEVEIEPKDAKNINEVESFTVNEEVIGSIKTVHIRK